MLLLASELLHLHPLLFVQFITHLDYKVVDLVNYDGPVVLDVKSVPEIFNTLDVLSSEPLKGLSLANFFVNVELYFYLGLRSC